MSDRINADPIRRPIVAVANGEVMADSRDIAAYFGKEHKRVLQTIREARCSDDFRRHNFVPFKIKDLTGESTSHVLMTKNGFAFVVLAFTGETAARFREDYILAFDAMEAELRRRAAAPTLPDLSNPLVLQQLLSEHVTKRIEAEGRAAELEGRMEEMRPQIQALERIAVSDGSLCITDAAKTLQVAPKALFRYLREHRWIYSRAGTSGDIAYQERLISGDLEHKTTTVLRPDGTEKTVTQVRVTPKGLTKLAKLLPPVASAA